MVEVQDITIYINKKRVEKKAEIIPILENVKNKIKVESDSVNFLGKDIFPQLKDQIMENYKEIQRKCINALHNICTYGYSYPILANIQDTGIIISSLNLLKTNKDLIQSLGITYLEKDVKKTSKTGFFRTYLVKQIFIHVECEKSLEINLDIINFEVDEFNKLNINGYEVKDYLEISRLLTCLIKKMKPK